MTRKINIKDIRNLRVWKLKYFPDTDTALVEFTNNEVFDTKEIIGNLYVGLDNEGDLVNMTKEYAKEKAGQSGFSYQKILNTVA